MNAVTTLPAAPPVSHFELAQRKAKALASSDIIPQAYRGNLPNVLIALEIAERIGASPLQVMQNLHLIQGKPSWSSSFLIATVNACGRFTPMRFEVKGEDPAKDDYRVRAFAEDKATGERCVGPWITWTMVKAEGWLKKPGSKWATMPELMFLYRAAGFWSRVYAPEVSMGILTREEVEDVWGGAQAHVEVAAPANAEGTLDALKGALLEHEPLTEAERTVVETVELVGVNVHDALANAADRDALDAAADLIRALPESEHEALNALYDKRAKELAE
ncbi:MAG TPA: hypothetical protein VFN69_04485 [Rudaea sp.]|nr:hypothetical protein [Rudaea sp.]